VDDEDLKSAYQSSEKRYKDLFDLVSDAIVTVDLEGVITSCNPAALVMLGYLEEELIGRHFSKLGIFHRRDIPKFIKTFSSIMMGAALPQTPVEFLFYLQLPLS